MPVARYFLWVGTVLLALLFIVDACLPKLPAGRATDPHKPVIRISSERKWPERIVFDTSAPMPRVATAAISAPVKAVQQTATVVPDRAREALAQLQVPAGAQTQAERPKKQEARRQQKFAKRHIAPPPTRIVTRPPIRIARQSQYAWFGDRMWW